MEIINETSYDSTDLEALWLRVRQQVEADAKADGKTWYFAPSVPSRLRVGYYTPTLQEDEPRFDQYSKLTSRRNYRAVPRLAIVRRKLFPLSPLEHLAMTAAEELCVPAEVVSDIAGTIAAWHGGKRDDPSGEGWEWTETFKLRFRLRIKRGKLEEATKARKSVQLSRLYQRRRDLREAKELHARLLAEKTKELEGIDEKIDALRKEVER